MKKYDDDMMNYDENGYYQSENEPQKSDSPTVFDKIVRFIIYPYFLITIFLIIRSSNTAGGGYKTILLFIHLFTVFGVLAMISEAIKRKKLSIPFLVITLCSLAAMGGVLAYHNGSDDTKKLLIKIGVFLFFMIFIVVGISVIISDIRGSKGNAERCTVSVTATCINVSTTEISKNNRITDEYYNPTYEYTYEGQTYKSTVNNVISPREKGMNYDIMIDPDDPNVIYEPDTVKNHTLAIIFGALFVVMPLIMMIVVFKFVL